MASNKSRRDTRSLRKDDVKMGVVGGIAGAGCVALNQIPLDGPNSIYAGGFGEAFSVVTGAGAGVGGLLVAAAVAQYRWHGSRTYQRRATFHAPGWATWNDYRDHLGANVIMSNKVKGGNRGLGALVRPSLVDKQFRGGYKRRPTDYGCHLGRIETGESLRMRRRDAWSSFEKGCLVIGPPGAGKTAKLIHWVLDAPGAVLTATTKLDVYEHTAKIRAERGPVLLFNPQRLDNVASTLTWDPVIGCEHYNVATARARALVHGTKAITAMQEASWGEKCVEILSKYLMAARLIGGDLSTVAYWLADVQNEEALTVLRDQRFASYVPPGWANALQAEIRSPADRMRGSIWSLAQSSVAFMSDPAVAAVCQKGSGSTFDVREFIRNRGTLYLVGSDENDTIAPLLSALTNYIYSEATVMAAEQPARRLDPTFAMILDEVAKITPVDLPGWGATARSAGIWLVAAVQTFDQLRERWGTIGAGTIESVFGTLFVLAGLKNDEDLTKISNLCGFRDEEIESVGRSVHAGGVSVSENTTEREKRIMPQAEIRMLPPQHALIITSGARAFVVSYEKGQIRATRMRDRLAAGKEPERGYLDSNQLYGPAQPSQPAAEPQKVSA
ncbi:type IV secretory system conjugative DNA transfer family protein [Amycolatopsis sp. NPDC059657]|uniref:type IV secretory system conjugative DNA transfer family protein n=1 Tax=Amycolatopsis sp. NPDC059657 TaxID=3346899 RepID=UPI0036703B73